LHPGQAGKEYTKISAINLLLNIIQFEGNIFISLRRKNVFVQVKFIFYNDIPEFGSGESFFKGIEMGLICYQINSFFHFIGPELLTCPECNHSLEEEVTENSEFGKEFRQSATIPWVHTYLFTCSNCHWWAIKEVIQDLEISTTYDLLVTEKISRASNENPSEEFDLKEILALKNMWENPRPMDREMATYFFGSEQIARDEEKHKLNEERKLLEKSPKRKFRHGLGIGLFFILVLIILFIAYFLWNGRF
jgi:hypothetical protein